MDDWARKDQNNNQGIIIVITSYVIKRRAFGFNVHVMVHGQKWNSRLVYDPSYPDIDHSVIKCDWSEFSWDAKEVILVNAPEPRCKEVDTCIFVDSDHSGFKLPHRLRSGFFYMWTPQCSGSQRSCLWLRHQFLALLIAMKQGKYTLRGLRYKLSLMGIPISGPPYIYGDNIFVVHNFSKPESVLRKNSNQYAIMQMVRQLVWESLE